MGKIRVMVAEDDAYIRARFVEMINSQEDMEVCRFVSSGQEMVDAMNEIQVDVILSDVEMSSRTDGILCAKQIMAFYPYVRIIFISVHDDDDIIFSAFEANAVDYLLKSASSEEVLSSIRTAYENCSPISPFVADKLRSEFNRLKKNEQSLMYFLNVVFMLTASEREIIRLLMDGYKVREIAEVRNVELSTIKSQITTLLKKFGVKRTRDILAALERLHIDDMFKILPPL